MRRVNHTCNINDTTRSQFGNQHNSIYANVDNDAQSIYIGNNYKPNELLLKKGNIKTVTLKDGRVVNEMSENTYSDCYDPCSKYKQIMIKKIFDSLINESSGLFTDEDNNIDLPYESQVEYRHSLAQGRRMQKIANNVISKYADDEY